jgi:hypothetical protein
LPYARDFAKRIEALIRSFVGVDPHKEAVVDLKPAPEKEESEEESAPSGADEDEDAESPIDFGDLGADFAGFKMPEGGMPEDAEEHDEL